MQTTITISADELRTIKRKAEDSQEWKEIATSLMAALIDVLYEENTEETCSSCGGSNFTHFEDCRAHAAVKDFTRKFERNL